MRFGSTAVADPLALTLGFTKYSEVPLAENRLTQGVKGDSKIASARSR